MFDLKVHEYKSVKDPVTGTVSTKLVRTRPYIRLKEQGDTNAPANSPIFIQDGKFFYEGGQEVDEHPAWLSDALAKLSPKARTEVGLERSISEQELEGSSKKKGR